MMSEEEYQENRAMLRMLVRSRESFQSQRKAIDNRIGRKADGSAQKIEARMIGNEEDVETLVNIADEARRQEKQIEKSLEQVLQRFPFYTEWLQHVKGIKANNAAWIIGEIDIRNKANSVSSIWKYAGMSPGFSRGCKSITKSKYKPQDGEIIGDLPPTKSGEKRYKVLTNDLIKDDRKTKDYLCPYNSRFRTALWAMARCLRDNDNQSSYVLEHYYALHVPEKYRKDKKAMEAKPHLAGVYGRLDNSEQITNETKKGGETVQIPWKEATVGHRDAAAKRKMIKEFLKDVYVNWKTIEGLPVRKPYAEEYLGKTHHKQEENHGKHGMQDQSDRAWPGLRPL